jgi:hypothetical protein
MIGHLAAKDTAQNALTIATEHAAATAYTRITVNRGHLNMQIKRTLETILATGGKILLIGIIGGLVYKSCFAPTRIENVTVVDKG